MKLSIHERYLPFSPSGKTEVAATKPRPTKGPQGAILLMIPERNSL